MIIILKLPKTRYSRNKYEEHQFTFRGLKHSEGARDGDIYDMKNISMDNYPSLSVRKKRQKLSSDIEGKVYGVGSANKLFWCSEPAKGNAYFYYDGEAKFEVSESEKTFAVINKYVCIFPDKMYFSLWGDEAKGTYESLEALNNDKGAKTDTKDGDVYAVGEKEPYSFFQFNSQGTWDDEATASADDETKLENSITQTRWIYLMDSWGNLEGRFELEDPEEDGTEVRSFWSVTLDSKPYMALSKDETGSDLKWLRVGDSVKILFNRYTDSSKSKEEIVTYYAKLEEKRVEPGMDDYENYYLYRFDKDVVISDDLKKKITIERVIPDLEFAFCHNNRLWGIDKDKICASSLGNPFNFTDHSSIADASWTVAVASSGPFTGGIAYNGYPTFFKEDSIIRVGGNYPAQYRTYETADIPGVLKGSGKSLAVANGVLYYLSPEGVCAYTGSYPTVIGDDIGEVLEGGIGGAGSDKYYLEAGVASGNKAVYVYDSRVRGWTKEDALGTVGFTDIGRDLYAVTEEGIYLIDSETAEEDAEEEIKSFIEFAPIYDGHLKKKGVSRIHLSIKAETGAAIRLLMSYDEGDYIEVMKIEGDEKRGIINIPLTVRRCGTYRLKIMGTGNYTVYAIGRERYFGSDM